MLKAREWRSAAGESFVHAVAGLGFSQCLQGFAADLRWIRSQDCSPRDDVYAIDVLWRMLVIKASNMSCEQRKEAWILGGPIPPEATTFGWVEALAVQVLVGRFRGQLECSISSKLFDQSFNADDQLEIRQLKRLA